MWDTIWEATGIAASIILSIILILFLIILYDLPTIFVSGIVQMIGLLL